MISEPPLAVLDTNVCLALWLFQDLGLRPLDEQLRRGALCWLRSPPMLAELLHEIRPERCARYECTPSAVRMRLETVPARDLPQPPTPAVGGLRCTDSADQMFIDLALATTARVLLSRDRALLKLTRRARTRGLLICTPEAWCAAASPMA